MAVLKFITKDNGAQSVMIPGISRMLMWYVVSSASLVHPGHLLEQSTVRGLALSGWMTSSVKEKRERCYSVHMTQIHQTVVIARMQVWSAFNEIITES